jgi:hypothetical protein
MKREEVAQLIADMKWAIDLPKKWKKPGNHAALALLWSNIHIVPIDQAHRPVIGIA